MSLIANLLPAGRGSMRLGARRRHSAVDSSSSSEDSSSEDDRRFAATYADSDDESSLGSSASDVESSASEDSSSNSESSDEGPVRKIAAKANAPLEVVREYAFHASIPVNKVAESGTHRLPHVLEFSKRLNNLELVSTSLPLGASVPTGTELARRVEFTDLNVNMGDPKYVVTFPTVPAKASDATSLTKAAVPLDAALLPNKQLDTETRGPVAAVVPKGVATEERPIVALDRKIHPDVIQFAQRFPGVTANKLGALWSPIDGRDDHVRVKHASPIVHMYDNTVARNAPKLRLGSRVPDELGDIVAPRKGIEESVKLAARGIEEHVPHGRLVDEEAFGFTISRLPQKTYKGPQDFQNHNIPFSHELDQLVASHNAKQGSNPYNTRLYDAAPLQISGRLRTYSLIVPDVKKA